MWSGEIMQTKMSEPTTLAVRRILVVDDEPSMIELIKDVIGRQLDCEVIGASSLREAGKILSQQRIHLLVTDVNLPDGDGTALICDLRKAHPTAEAIVITGEPTMDCAINAMREGAVDFLPKPFTAKHLSERVCQALARHGTEVRRVARVKKLRRAVRRLNQARKLVSKKVDLLCNDLIGAYGELSQQIETVRLQEGYKQFIGQTADLEQLLCHTMDWLLRQMGYANVGIWLAADDEEFSLGAYMKYTVASTPDLTEALEKNLVRMAARKGFVHMAGKELEQTLTPAELAHLAESDVLAINCTYLADSLGAIVLFRDARTPFTEDDIKALKVVSPLFAVALTKSVKGGEAPAEDSAEPADDAGPTSEPPTKPRRPKQDPADWWKNGGDSPY